jgi:hypothetical protein
MLRRERRAASWRTLIGGAFALLLLAGGAARADAPANSPYAPYRFLIGTWDVAPEAGGAPMARALFRWGPNHSCIWYSGSLLVKGVEVPHFERLLPWNGVRKNLDMLLALDLDGGRVQEQGVVSIEADGTVVRHITAFYSEGEQPIGQPVAGAGGAKARFRQTFQAAGPDRIRTTVMRELGKGWVATFPGSDHLVMIRRSKA